MSDSQWPRYYVFKQDNPEGKHQSCGTVHAPDPEMALQIARDVFVRRPACHSLWVALAEQVLAQDGGVEPQATPHASEAREDRAYLIFARPNQRDHHLFQCEIEADSAAQALEAFQQDNPELVDLGAWVVPRSAIHASQPGEEEAWFQPAEEKAYRHGSFYHPDQLLRKLRLRDD